MYALNDNTTSRSSTRRPGTPWAYRRHLRAVANVRFAVGIFLTGLTAVLFARGSYGWAVLPLAGAAAHFSLGYWQLVISRSAPRPHYLDR
jgi:hypothetical protein